MPRAPALRRVGADRYDVTMAHQSLLAQAKGLGVPERVELINELWASIDADTLPVSAAEAELVDRRLAEATAEPLVGRSWKDVHSSLRDRAR